MAEPFLGEIRMMSFAFAPQGWAVCNGQLLPINQNQALFSLLGTTYGGNGTINFALPDLRGRAPMHRGNGHSLGERAGEQATTLTLAHLPTHTHALRGVGATGNTAIPNNALLADSPSQLYAAPTALTALHANTVTQTGAGQPHPNMQPFLTINFCIALQGIFPSQN